MSVTDDTNQVETKEISDLQATVDKLHAELDYKESYIELLLERDRELTRIHHTRYWSVIAKASRAKDHLLPKDSRRGVAVQLAKKFLRHPIGYLKKVNPEIIKELIIGKNEQGIAGSNAKIDSYLGGDLGERSFEPFPVIEYESLCEVPHLRVPLAKEPLVSIIIPVYNQFSYTYACLKSIVMNSGAIPYEVIIANDMSTDLTTHLAELVGGVRIINNKENMRFLRNCNHAANYARGKYILFLNNDTQVQYRWLSSLVDLIESDESIGMVGSKFLCPDGRLMEAGSIIWDDGSASNYGRGKDPTMPEYNYVKDVDYVSGASILIRSDLWHEIGGFDDDFSPAYYEDVDLAFEVRKRGFRMVYQPLSAVLHYEGISNGRDTTKGQKAYQVINKEKMYEKWKHDLSLQAPCREHYFLARERSLHKPLLLFVDRYVPEYDADAGSRVVFDYIKLFVRKGFQVKFLADNFLRSEPYTSVLEQMGVEVFTGEWYYLNIDKWIADNAHYFDYVVLNRPWVSVKYIDSIKKHSSAKILYVGADLHYLRLAREYETTGEIERLKMSESMHDTEYDIMRKSYCALYHSDVEVEIVHKEDSTVTVDAIPVYIYKEVPEFVYTIKGRRDLLFVGGFSHRPNADAMKWFIAEILPRVRKQNPNISIHIVGAHTPDDLTWMRGEGVIVEGRVSDIRLQELYDTCRMTVAPLRFGAGVKGKIIESMYYGLPVITTSCGAEGIQDPSGVLIALETAEAIADKIVEIYDDEQGLQEVSEEQRKIINRFFSEEYAVEVLSAYMEFPKEIDGKP